MKYQVLFSLKKKKKIFQIVVCGSCDRCFKGLNGGKISSLSSIHIGVGEYVLSLTVFSLQS